VRDYTALTEDEARAERDRVQDELSGLVGRTDDGAVDRRARLNRAFDELDTHIARQTARRAAVRQQAENGHGGDREAPATMAPRRSLTPAGEYRDRALRALEARHDLRADEGDRLVDYIERDVVGVDCDYLTAVGAPEYERAFTKLISGNPGAAQLLTREEAAAVEHVGRVMNFRGLLAGDNASGGYAIPLAIDPTVRLTTDGAINPLRDLATVRTITTSEVRALTSAGVTAAFAAEGDEVTDESPTLGQVTIRPQRAHAFVTASFEALADWSSIRETLAMMFQDAKDRLEADKFLNGAGEAANDEPEGLITGLNDVVGSHVDTAISDATSVYAVQEALGPRWQPRATWISSLATANVIHRLQDEDEPALFNADRSRLLGKPWTEASEMADHDPGALLYGDFREFHVVDRIGMTVEVVPHMLGANRLPTLERGILAYWRTSSAVVVPAAFSLAAELPS
jgi:HK97 family phage major capsid protein